MKRIALLMLLIAGAAHAAPVAFSESDTLPRGDRLERLARVSQLDALTDTGRDSLRCAPATVLNAYLALGGVFDTLATRLGVPVGETYEHVHRAQEALYELADFDGSGGVYAATRPVFDPSGQVIGSRLYEGDELHRVLDALGLTVKALYGPTDATLYQRRESINAFMSAEPEGVLLVGVQESPDGTSLPPMEGRPNHFILMSRRGEAWWKLDAWHAPGSSGLVRLRSGQADSLLERNTASMWGLTRAPGSEPHVPPAELRVPPAGPDLSDLGSRAARTPAATPSRTPFEPFDLFRLETATDPQASPDGRRVVYVRNAQDIMRDDYLSTLWIVNRDGSGHLPLTTGALHDHSPRFTPDGRTIVYVSDVLGKPTLLKRDLDSGRTVRLAELAQSPGAFAISPDGTQLVFAMRVPAQDSVPRTLPGKPAGAEWAAGPTHATRLRWRVDGAGVLKSGTSQLFLLSLAGGTPTPLTSGGLSFDAAHRASEPVWTPDGRTVVIAAAPVEGAASDVLNRHADVYAIDVASKALRRVASLNGTALGPVVSPDGQTIAFGGGPDVGRAYIMARVYTVPIAGGVPRMLAPAFDRPALGLQWTRDGRALWVVADDRGSSVLYRMTLDGRTEKRLDGLGSDLLCYDAGEAVHECPDGALVLTHRGTDTPGDVCVLEPGHPQPTRLTAINDDFFAMRAPASVESFEAKARDGRMIHCFLLRSPLADRTRPAPLLLEIHGGPFAAYGARFDLEKQWYAARGMNVLFVNPRGSTGYGEAFSLLIDKKYPGDDAQDLLAAVDACIARGIADPKRLYVAGGSGGGVLTCYLTTLTDRFRAAVSLYPVVDWSSQILTSDVGPWIAGRWVRGMPWDAAAEQHARSPLAGVARVHTPTRLQVGEQDHRTPPDQAIMWFQALQMLGVESDLLTYPGDSHGIGAMPSHWLTSVQWTMDWFARH